MKTTLSSSAICTPYQDLSYLRRTDGEIPPPLGIQLEQFYPAKEHLIIKDTGATCDICKFQKAKQLET